MTDDDKALLEAAAKAAWIDVHESEDGTMQRRPILCVYHYVQGQRYTEIEWNPLRDDASALQLAINLQIDICFGPDLLYTQTNLAGTPMIVEKYGSDPSAATRRAIVKAAAAMGSGKP